MRPLILNKLIKTITRIKLMEKLYFIRTLNWSLKIETNKTPEQQNKRVLKKAWKNICIRARKIKLEAQKNMIILICLIVEKATTFLKSISILAMIPPIKKVKILKQIKKSKVEHNLKLCTIFWTRKIPAVTSVEECTIAEIGVGADMAAGSQQERGNWALFLKLHKIKITHKRNLNLVQKKIK